MKEKNKYIIILIGILMLFNTAYATISKSAVTVSKFGIAFEIIVCCVILYLFLMGVINCFSRTIKNYKNTAYYNGNKLHNSQIKEKFVYDYEITQRVKKLMETKKKNEFQKNSTINEHLKKEEKISV